MALINATQLCKKYLMGSNTINALDNVNIKIEKAEFISVAGPSGSGKSTFLNILGLIDTPTSGKIIFDDKDVFDLKEKELHRFRKKKISFIFQNFNLIPILSAYENIEFPMLINKVSKKDRTYQIDKYTEAVGIKEYLNHRPDELSGGQQQRVSIARALVTSPEVVLADEPTANLDSVNSKNILDLLKDLQKNNKTTFLIATHDNEVMSYADRLIKIRDGKIIEDR
jgi:putative ABC transport system ATP-binding protein